MNNKIKVVWVCSLMNDSIRAHLCSDLSLKRKILILVFKTVSWLFTIGARRRIDNYLHYKAQSDYGLWNYNAIREFQEFESVDLHVIVTSNMTSCQLANFDERGVHYYIIQNSESLLFKALGSKVHLPSYKKNRKQIIKVIRKIQPDIVHIIGAENPEYSQAVFDIYKDYPVIVQLQTLLSDPDLYREGQPYFQMAKMEKKILSLPVFIGTPMRHFREVILSDINHNATIFDTSLAVSETIDRSECVKSYDFVYFSANINKAADLAIEAFCIAYKQHPEITLDIIGAYSADFKSQLESVLLDNGALSNVEFEGSLPTHNDVISRIRKARFALLPLKIDMISGTIREACANGLPVVTTITGGTPELNKERETSLLSAIGDASAMADNMIRLINDPELAEKLKTNGYIYAESLSSNHERMLQWVKKYYEIVEGLN